MPPRRRPLGGDDEPRLGPKEEQFGGEPVTDSGSIFDGPGGDPNYPTPFVDYTPEEIAGNLESARNIFGATGAGPRTGQAPRPGRSEPLGQPIDEIISMLPQGVEAPGQGEGQGGVSAPMQSSEPQSVSMRAMPPSAGTGTAPMRQPVSSPMQFGSGGRSLIGRNAGQFGGGLGMPGGPSGSPQATKQMLAILEQLLSAG